jgi:hypothetical protein
MAVAVQSTSISVILVCGPVRGPMKKNANFPSLPADEWDCDSGWDCTHPLMVMYDEERLWREWRRDRCEELGEIEASLEVCGEEKL